MGRLSGRPAGQVARVPRARALWASSLRLPGSSRRPRRLPARALRHGRLSRLEAPSVPVEPRALRHRSRLVYGHASPGRVGVLGRRVASDRASASAGCGNRRWAPAEAGTGKAALAATRPSTCGLDERCDQRWSINIDARFDHRLVLAEWQLHDRELAPSRSGAHGELRRCWRSSSSGKLGMPSCGRVRPNAGASSRERFEGDCRRDPDRPRQTAHRRPRPQPGA